MTTPLDGAEANISLQCLSWSRWLIRRVPLSSWPVPPAAARQKGRQAVRDTLVHARVSASSFVQRDRSQEMG